MLKYLFRMIFLLVGMVFALFHGVFLLLNALMVSIMLLLGFIVPCVVFWMVLVGFYNSFRNDFCSGIMVKVGFYITFACFGTFFHWYDVLLRVCPNLHIRFVLS